MWLLLHLLAVIPICAITEASNYTYTFSSGHALLYSNSSAIVQFVDGTNPQRQFLLNETTATFHTRSHAWGAGTISTDSGEGSWNLDHIPYNNFTGPYNIPLDDGLRLRIIRSPGRVLTETYIFENTSPERTTVTGLHIQTPFNDLYDTALWSLTSAVNAHIFTGGAWAWALAEPMSGEGRSLGLIVRKGHLWSYSLESSTSSDVRGHIVLQVTDAKGDPNGFGGQPVAYIDSGDSYVLEWEIGFYNNTSDFIEATKPPATFSAYSAPLDQEITVSSEIKPTSSTSNLKIRRRGTSYTLSASSPGTYNVDIGDSRTEISFHLPLETVVRERAHYILEHQRPVQRPAPLNAAFVAIDTENLTTIVSSTWDDWGDGSERIAMPTLLQLAAMQGYISSELVDIPLRNWVEFASTSLFDSEGNTRRCTGCSQTQRPYDAIWLVMFFNDRYKWLGNSTNIDTAVTLLNRAFEVGRVQEAPIIFFSQAILELCDSLDKLGRYNESATYKRKLVDTTMSFVNDGRDLPASEVSYEQSIVEPLVEMVADTFNLTRNATLLSQTQERLNWLMAFSGSQPHARLYQIANRHWDDYWFGLRRQWGDVFPHYWSALTSQALIRLPRELRTKQTDDIALKILRSNMVNFFPGGSATCAFVYPSAVNGNSANVADPMANDQDWHLVIWLRLLEYGVPSA
ncbi:hypothetical protein BO85DRAFT_505270 [Aspergillus piperis CBS 112811]|uniref:Six-hairpin glycosidase n=1 Tax=Aspergillus piperis CBS 112811 TaxID=1448313 RepID=A0A8G1QRS6_9EURO|nr:hypothetical protein BO85DRAFT_505270 [Aspergillus piperis CBS 112811]RAH53126.1 hypothetical protein BO85DRAFT_505270 [Aspergillus piperis CBS 112811]